MSLPPTPSLSDIRLPAELDVTLMTFEALGAYETGASEASLLSNPASAFEPLSSPTLSTTPLKATRDPSIAAWTESLSLPLSLPGRLRRSSSSKQKLSPLPCAFGLRSD